jgi:hypothetical protein
MALMKKTAADALFDKWLRQWASREHVERLEKVIEEFVPNWSLGPVVRALQTLRGFDRLFAVTVATEASYSMGRKELEYL